VIITEFFSIGAIEEDDTVCLDVQFHVMTVIEWTSGEGQPGTERGKRLTTVRYLEFEILLIRFTDGREKSRLLALTQCFQKPSLNDDIRSQGIPWSLKRDFQVILEGG
jgi:hypothetical protein